MESLEIILTVAGVTLMVSGARRSFGGALALAAGFLLTAYVLGAPGVAALRGRPDGDRRRILALGPAMFDELRIRAIKLLLEPSLPGALTDELIDALDHVGRDWERRNPRALNREALGAAQAFRTALAARRRQTLARLRASQEDLAS